MAIQEKRATHSHRTKLADELRTRGSLRSKRVEAAFLSVKREAFISKWYTMGMPAGVPTWTPTFFDSKNPSSEQLDAVYSLAPLVTAVTEIYPIGSLSAPPLVAEMLELLDAFPGMKVLEIGTCSGYNAALLAEIVSESGEVHTLEARPEAAIQATKTLSRLGYQNIHVYAQDGFHGREAPAPYDRIIATVGCSDVSPHWISQLREGGSMLLPITYGYMDYLLSLTRDPKRPAVAQGRVVGRCSFMSISGILAWANPWRTWNILGTVTSDFRELSLPDHLPIVESERHPLSQSVHADFYFFLTQSCRELWYCNQGYGLADQLTGAKTIITNHSIRAFGPPGTETSSYRLIERLLRIYDHWVSSGCPTASDHHLEFVPKESFYRAPYAPDSPRSIIERVFHIELGSL